MSSNQVVAANAFLSEVSYVFRNVARQGLMLLARSAVEPQPLVLLICAETTRHCLYENNLQT